MMVSQKSFFWMREYGTVPSSDPFLRAMAFSSRLSRLCSTVCSAMNPPTPMAPDMPAAMTRSLFCVAAMAPRTMARQATTPSMVPRTV